MVSGIGEWAFWLLYVFDNNENSYLYAVSFLRSLLWNTRISFFLVMISLCSVSKRCIDHNLTRRTHQSLGYGLY